MLTISRRATFFSLLAILLLAAFLRFWRLDTMPPGLYHDEAYNGLDALGLIKGQTFPAFYEGWELYAQDAHRLRPAVESQFPIFFEGNYGREPLHIYLMSLSIRLWGATPLAIRAVPAFAGVLAVLTTFLAARALFSGLFQQRQLYTSLTPLLAALTLAILYPTVHFSRFGIRAMVFVPLETLAVYAFWKGVRAEAGQQGQGRHWVWFLLAGSLLGLAIYTFAAARLLPLVWLLFVPIWFWRDTEARKRHWRHIAGMAVAATAVALPLLLFFARYPYFFVFRIAFVANKGLGAVEGKPWLTWLLNVGRVLRGLVWQGETHLRHNLPGRPYMDFLQTALFATGMIRSLAWLRRFPFLFLLVWFAVMLLPSILSGDAPHFGRLSGVAAPVAIFVAVGATFLTESLYRWLSARRSQTQAARLALLIISIPFMISGLLVMRDYFGRYASHPDLAIDFYQSDWLLGQAAAAAPGNPDIYLAPAQEELATILFALGDAQRLRNVSGSESLIPAGRPQTAALYLVRPEAKAMVKALLDYFPTARLYDDTDGVQVVSVPASGAHNGVQEASNHDFAGQIKLLGWTVDGHAATLDVTLAWQAEQVQQDDYTAYVHLIDEAGVVVAQSDRQPAGYPTSDWRLGEVVVDRLQLRLPQDLAPGAYGLETGFYSLPDLQRLGEAAIIGPWQR